ncbi:hypothetical protein AB1I62_09200 [Enterococcus sp. AN402]|uniref:hypothetical protein n=1 Tax=Enterococcus sp. AN402 TaxID=3151386 RepID=UPI003459F55A
MSEELRKEERYGIEIFEAISYSKEFPVPKKKLLHSFNVMIKELEPLLEKEELEEYIQAKKFIQSLPEFAIELICELVVRQYEKFDSIF